ncbi:MAG: nickel-dependent lactate racemase [Elusimicrobiota bacterium]|nr:nickel-dependent lactate racemase [Endomicrobiia bacterium]MDW8166559.1 nickel-dependent lactate racemase [Elusimicrobiota bacterium]
MKISLKYGNTQITLPKIPSERIKILQPKVYKDLKEIKDIKTSLKNSLNKPLGNKSLVSIIEKINPKLISIVVPDITRVTPYYKDVLLALIEYIPNKYHKNIKFIIATGTHRAHTQQENINLYGIDLVSKFEFISHNCDDKDKLVFIGRTSLGNNVYLNKYVVKSDLVILTGNIDTHAFAGFSGGAKILLPGVASRESITYNHSFVVDEFSVMGNLHKNKIYKDIMETYYLLKKKTNIFCINFIKNSKKNLIKILSGDLEKVFKKGTEIITKISSVKINTLSDLTIISCGGYPRDINLYQAQKSLSCASMVTRPNGVIILLAECKEKIGQKIFGDTLINNTIEEILSLPQEKIEVEVHRAYLTAKILKNFKCILVSSLDKELVEKLKFIYSKDINTALKLSKMYLKKISLSYIIPEGSTLLPIFKK